MFAAFSVHRSGRRSQQQPSDGVGIATGSSYGGKKSPSKLTEAKPTPAPADSARGQTYELRGQGSTARRNSPKTTCTRAFPECLADRPHSESCRLAWACYRVIPKTVVRMGYSPFGAGTQRVAAATENSRIRQCPPGHFWKVCQSGESPR
jgi:hypothetical protein